MLVDKVVILVDTVVAEEVVAVMVAAGAGLAAVAVATAASRAPEVRIPRTGRHLPHVGTPTVLAQSNECR